MKVFVTGSTGYIGVNLLHRLLQEGHEPVALARETSSVEYLPDGATVIRGDIRQPSTFQSTLRKCDAIVHLAAVYEGYAGTLQDRVDMNWNRAREVNVEGTRTLTKLANEHDLDRFIYMSTILAHPEVGSDPDAPYQQSKTMGERAVVEESDSVDYAIIYPTFVLGPRDYRLNRFSYFQRVATNVLFAPPLYAPGAFNIIHVDDVCKTIVHSLHPEADQRYIASGENLSTSQFYRSISRVTEQRGVVIPVPFAITSRLLPPLINVLHERELFPTGGEGFRVRTNGGVVPTEYVNQAPVEQRSAEETIADTCRWYEQAGLL